MTKGKFKIIPTVYLVLAKQNKVLLSRRYQTGFFDGYYSLPAGHLKGGETLIEAIIREAKEEIGLKIKPKDLKLVHVLHRKEPKEERINFFFLVKKWQGTPKIMEPEKCDRLSWFNLKKLPKNTIPYIRQALKKIKSKTFYSHFGWK